MAAGRDKKTIKVKPLLLARVRCASDNHPKQSHWLRRLYVIWAAVDPAKQDAPSKFHFGQTDTEGYLSPLKSGLDPDPQKTIPLAEDTEYLFYFVRHPDDALPRKVLEDLNAGQNDVWGKGQIMKVGRAPPPTRKSRRGNAIKELILTVPESPESFIPTGSKFYDNWVLFRDMPCAQCAPVHKQVRRLQYHLGALRYPIGNHGHPYAPELLDHEGTIVKTSNPGQFDVALWNGVLAFQRDIAEGSANKVETFLIEESLSKGDFDPLADMNKPSRQLALSMKYGNSAEDRPVKFSAVTTDYPTVVDAATGDAIKSRLEGGLRKPGDILVSPQTVATYMNSAMLRRFNEWDHALKSLGFRQGIQVGNIFREPRIGVVTGGGGVSTSLHKSGFAMDLRFSAGKNDAPNWGDPKAGYPLHFSLDPATKPPAARWIVYAEIPERNIPSYMIQTKDGSGKVIRWESPKNGDNPVDGNGKPSPPAIYHRTINPWKFDAQDSEGGKSQGETTKPGSVFLEFTTLAKHFGFTNIGAHKGQYLWKHRDAFAFTLDETTLGTMIARFRVHLDQQRDPDLKPASLFRIGGSDVSFVAFKAEINFLEKWGSRLSRFSPGPDIACLPHTKEGHALIKALRGNAASFKGRKFLLIKQPDSLEEEISLTARTEFPTIPFTLRPVTSPVAVYRGATIEFPEYLGNAGHLEWWHFQFVDGYIENGSPKKWKALLGAIGWTEEGLLGASGNMPIYGHWGIGYSPNDLRKDAS